MADIFCSWMLEAEIEGRFCCKRKAEAEEGFFSLSKSLCSIIAFLFLPEAEETDMTPLQQLN